MKNTTQNEQIVKAAPLAVSGMLGADFWEEVNDRLENAEKSEKEMVKPRPGRNY
jgi:hypothetical protein